jgi:hypothetical protein
MRREFMRKGFMTIATGLMLVTALPATSCSTEPPVGGAPSQEDLEVEVDFELTHGLGDFQVEAGEPAFKRATGRFSVGSIPVGGGSVEIDINGITVTPEDATGEKAGVVRQADRVLEITIWFAPGTLSDTICSDDETQREQYGPYRVTLDEDYVPVEIEPTPTLTDSTIELLNAADEEGLSWFSYCIRVVSPVTGLVQIESFTLRLTL